MISSLQLYTRSVGQTSTSRTRVPVPLRIDPGPEARVSKVERRVLLRRGGAGAKMRKKSRVAVVATP